MSESTFKYLDNAQGTDAAQDFLDKKMSKNKYMSVSNPENPYSMGEGSTPSAPVYKPDSAPEKPKTDSSELSGGQKTIKDKGSLSDLGFDDARIEEIRNHAQGASGSGSFGYTSDTEQHFKETEDGTSAGSIEADMRKIGKHLGYEHWGTANPERIKEYIMAQEKAPEAAALKLKKRLNLSNTHLKSSRLKNVFNPMNKTFSLVKPLTKSTVKVSNLLMTSINWTLTKVLLVSERMPLAKVKKQQALQPIAS